MSDGTFRVEFQAGRWVVAWGDASALVLDGWGRCADWQHCAYDRQWRASAVACLLGAVSLAIRQIPPPYGNRGSEDRKAFCELVAHYANERWTAEHKRGAA